MGNFRHVQSGAPLVISATEYNAMLDAGKASRNRPVRHKAHGQGFDSLFVHVANMTGQRLRRFDVVGLDGPLFPAGSDDFCSRIALAGVVPDKEKHAGKFAVLQADCEPNELVRACISGVTVARIGPGNGDMCDVTSGETGLLSHDDGGTARIIWEGDEWAIVHVGGGGGSGGNVRSGITQSGFSQNSTFTATVRVRLHVAGDGRNSPTGETVSVFASILKPGGTLAGNQYVQIAQINGRWELTTGECP